MMTTVDLGDMLAENQICYYQYASSFSPVRQETKQKPAPSGGVYVQDTWGTLGPSVPGLWPQVSR